MSKVHSRPGSSQARSTPEFADPLEIHMDRLLRIHGDRIQEPDRLTALSVRSMTADAKQRWIDKVSRDLGIVRLVTTHLSVVDD